VSVSILRQTKQGFWVFDGDRHHTAPAERLGRLDADERIARLCSNFLTAGDVVVDAGAFIGDHTIAYQRTVGSSGRVLAFEPNVLARTCGERNVPSAEWHKEALGLGDGVLYLNENGGNPGGSWLSLKPTPKEVRVISLDSLNLQRLNFLKVDVEGREVDLLRGAKETLSRCRPKIWIEINPDALYRVGTSPQELVSLLRTMKYVMTGWPDGIKRTEEVPTRLCDRLFLQEEVVLPGGGMLLTAGRSPNQRIVLPKRTF
jgi:FkbM family methyltransferase